MNHNSWLYILLAVILSGFATGLFPVRDKPETEGDNNRNQPDAGIKSDGRIEKEGL